MKTERKKRGWVYRGLLGLVILLMATSLMLLPVSKTWAFAIDLPLYSHSAISLRVGGGIVDIKYQTTHKITASFNYHNFRKIMQSAGVPYLPRYMWWKWRWQYAVYHSGLSLRFLFPHWILCVLLMIWPTISTVVWARSRPLPGHCTACNYDLRGSTESTTCPECGEAIKRPLVQDAEA